MQIKGDDSTGGGQPTDDGTEDGCGAHRGGCGVGAATLKRYGCKAVVRVHLLGGDLTPIEAVLALPMVLMVVPEA